MPRVDDGLAFILKYENVAWYQDGTVRILDRRAYPHETEFVVCKDYREVAQAIADMVTQSGGPWLAAQQAMVMTAYQVQEQPPDRAKATIKAKWKAWSATAGGTSLCPFRGLTAWTS